MRTDRYRRFSHMKKSKITERNILRKGSSVCGQMDPFCVLCKLRWLFLFRCVMIKRVCFYGFNICVSLVPDSAAGSFYTFSIVMFSSLIYPLFSRFISGDKPEYRRMHIAYITVLIFIMLFCGVYYSFSTLDQPMVDYSKLHKSDMELDCPQFFFFILALVFSVYSFGLTLIGQHEDVLHLSDDYLVKENKQVKELEQQSASSSSTATTASGIKIRI